MACMPAPISPQVFDRILSLKAAGWSQTRIAAEVGRGQSTVSRVLLGKTPRSAACSKCGGPMKAANATGICHSNPECDLASHHAAYMARTDGVLRLKSCSVCGRSVKMNSIYGVCNRKDNPACMKAHDAARHAAHPEHVERQLRRRAVPEVWCKGQIGYLRGRSLLVDLDVLYLLEQWGDGHCPCCGVEYVVGAKSGRAVSPSMDRVYGARGYRKGNVRVICMRCNRRKGEMSAAELLALAQDTLRAEAWADSWPST